MTLNPNLIKIISLWDNGFLKIRIFQPRGHFLFSCNSFYVLYCFSFILDILIGMQKKIAYAARDYTNFCSKSGNKKKWNKSFPQNFCSFFMCEITNENFLCERNRRKQRIHKSFLYPYKLSKYISHAAWHRSFLIWF